MLVKFFQGIIDVLVSLLNLITSVLPTSPFQSYFLDFSLNYGDILGYINYFIPIDVFVTILTNFYLPAVVIFYLWSVAARWVKLIK